MQVCGQLDGLNFLLHGATVLGLELDTQNYVAKISLQITTVPKTGPAPVRAALTLGPISALVVTVQTADGNSPRREMAPISIDQLSHLASLGHPLTGFDFIDSKRSSEPRGGLVFELFRAEVPADHILNFYYGTRSPHNEAALLFFRIYFDEARLAYHDGREIPIEAFAPSGDTLARALAFGSELGSFAPIKVLPDPVEPSLVDGELLALVFVDTEPAIHGYVVGRAHAHGDRVTWLSPDRVLYELPDASARSIRPRFPEMSMGPKRLDGFEYFVLLPRPVGHATAKEWVATSLKRH